MTSNFGGVAPEELAFDPEYWGELHPVERSKVPYRHVSIVERKSVSDRLGYYAPRVARGEVHGTPVSPGVAYDPYERNAGAYAQHCYHGAVLLIDLEGICPHPTNRYVPEEPEHRDIMSVPVHKILRRNRIELLKGVKVYSAQPEAFSNGSGEVYFRGPLMVVMAASRRGIAPMWMSAANEATVNGKVVKANAAATRKNDPSIGTTVVGETFVTYDKDGSMKSVKRIRGIKICAAGTPLEAQESAFSFSRQTAGNEG